MIICLYTFALLPLDFQSQTTLTVNTVCRVGIRWGSKPGIRQAWGSQSRPANRASASPQLGLEFALSHKPSSKARTLSLAVLGHWLRSPLNPRGLPMDPRCCQLINQGHSCQRAGYVQPFGQTFYIIFF